jgi:hypothetical protein
MPARAYYSVPASSSGGKPEGQGGLDHLSTAIRMSVGVEPTGGGFKLESLDHISIECLLRGKKVLRGPRRYDTHPLIP